jgi:hypothetical protein
MYLFSSATANFAKRYSFKGTHVTGGSPIRGHLKILRIFGVPKTLLRF